LPGSVFLRKFAGNLRESLPEAGRREKKISRRQNAKKSEVMDSDQVHPVSRKNTIFAYIIISAI